MIDGKRAARSGSIQSAARGEGIKGRGRGCAPWGDIRGEEKAGRHDEAKRFGMA